MKRFLSRQSPDPRRILLVESGSRTILEKWFRGLNSHYGAAHTDIITCYDSIPLNVPEQEGRTIYLTHNYQTPESRNHLVKALQKNNYDMIGIICSDESIMTRWKWFLAWKIPAKVFIINENSDWFWLDRGSIGILKSMASNRTGMSGSGILRQPFKLILFPFTLAYLAAYATFMHLRRKVFS